MATATGYKHGKLKPQAGAKRYLYVHAVTNNQPVTNVAKFTAQHNLQQH